MASYLLLRNNKESGPYSLDELLNYGLKPYDLVWVNGKSAAWRYPSEVAELKPYAPEVEEQPFDRFYKKPAEEKIEAVIAEKKEIFEKAIIPQPAQHTAQFSKEEEKYLPKIKQEEIVSDYRPKKSVFVTMPGQAKKIVAEKPKQAQAEQLVPVEEKKYTQEKILSEPVYDYSATQQTATQTVSITENPATARIKYSQPLDEIKEMYVKTLHDRKHKIARKSFWLKNLKIAGVVLALVMVGVAAGLAIRKSPADTSASKQIAQAVLPPQTIAVTNNEDTGITAETEQALKQEDTDPRPLEETPIEHKTKQLSAEAENTIDEPVTRKPVEEKANLRSSDNDKKPVLQKEKENEGISKNASEFIKDKEQAEYYPGTETNTATGERKKTSRNETTPVVAEDNTKPVVKKSNSAFDNKVEVSSNNYQRVALGGIRNLQLTVSNDSKYTLDNVMVELQYVRPNEQALKTENIIFRGVAAHGSSTIKVPDTNRGIRVNYKIVHIESKQLNDELATR